MGTDGQVHVARGDGCAMAACLLDLKLFFQVLFHDARSTEKRGKKLQLLLDHLYHLKSI